MFIRDSTKEDLQGFIPAYHDVLEAEALGIEPSFPDVSECITLDHEGVPMAIGGNIEGRCWFVTSEEVWKLPNRFKMEFHRLISEHRDSLLKRHDTLWNYVFVGNKPHIKFLKSIGAVFHKRFTDDGQFQLFTIVKEGLKHCNKCETTRPLEDFHTRKGVSDGRASTCKFCNNSRTRFDKHGKYNPDKDRRKHLLRTYGITSEDYDRMLAEQNGTCAICHRPERIKGRSLCVDHCHSTGEVRGLLCNACNIAIGKLEDNLDYIKNALKYLGGE